MASYQILKAYSINRILVCLHVMVLFGWCRSATETITKMKTILSWRQQNPAMVAFIIVMI